MPREIVSTGNKLEALAAIDAGCRFFGGYPITPSSEIAHEMSRLLPTVGGVFIQMEDEIAGISVALGASMSGTKSMTNTSGPGISLKAEQIGLSFMTETPLVITNVMRGGPSTGLPTRPSQQDILQALAPTHGDYQSISLCPGSLDECYSEAVRAFNLAERFMTPVFVLSDETLGHMIGKAVLPDIEEVKANTVKRRVYKGDPSTYEPYNVPADEPAILNPFFKGYRYHITGLHHGPTGFPTEDAKLSQELIDRLFNKILAHKDEIESFEEYMLDDADIMVIAYGSVSLAVKEAIKSLRKEGIKVGLFRPITLWPSPEEKIYELCNKFDKILVAEMNKGQYFKEIQRASARKADTFETLFKVNGRAISPAEFKAKIKEMI